MKQRIYTATVTFSVWEAEDRKFPTVRDVESGVRTWAADWSYADQKMGRVLAAHAQRRPDLEARSKKRCSLPRRLR